MNNVFSKLRGLKKSTKIIATALVAAVIVPATLFAWGPTRPTYTKDNVADHITFNSITDNPEIGDERNFVRIKDAADTNPGGWGDYANAEDGKEYSVMMYVHNNAASNLNLTAENVRVSATVPNNTAKSITVEGFVDSSNATPTQVWDQAVFQSDKDFNLTYVPGSAVLYNKANLNGIQLSDNIVSAGGAPVGYSQLDGKQPGCFQYAGYVYFKVKVNTPKTVNFDMIKKVSKHGANDWQKSYTAQPGEVVDYIIRYKNTGDAIQHDVMVKDQLPSGMTYVPGSTTYATVAHPDGLAVPDGVTTTGVNIGDYGPGGGTWVKFSAKVADNDSLTACGNNILHNVARVETDFGYKEDSADVSVNKTCAPGQITVCEIATGKIITINDSSFDSNKYSKNLADCQVTELPQTGIDTGVMTFVGLGVTTAAAAYAATSDRVRNLLRR